MAEKNDTTLLLRLLDALCRWNVTEAPNPPIAGLVTEISRGCGIRWNSSDQNLPWLDRLVPLIQKLASCLTPTADDSQFVPMAQVPLRKDGSLPLHFAAMLGHAGIVQVLLKQVCLL